MASKKQVSKLSRISNKGVFTLLCSESSLLQLELLSLSKSLGREQQWELQTLLDQFESLFDTPTGLPPKRSHDHQIPLKDESQIVKLKPYRYPTLQKNEIEHMISEMKKTRVIRDSCSSFASPVVLVKKKDGSWRLCIDYRQLIS